MTRANAESSAFSAMVLASRNYAKENNGQFPDDVSQLRPYFNSPLDDAILHLRNNEFEIGTLIFKSTGDVERDNPPVPHEEQDSPE